MSEKLFGIVVITWNRPELTKQTIENLMKVTNVKHTFTIVDNGSYDEELIEYLKTVKGNDKTQDFKIIWNNKNYGIALGKNIGLKHSLEIGADIVLLSDDDILYPQQYDKQLMEIYEKIPAVGAAGVCVEKEKFPVKVINGVRCRPKSNNLGGATLTLSRRVVDSIGFLRGSVYGLEDSDWYVRTSLAGLKSIYTEARGVHLDKDIRKEYRKQKNFVHQKGSCQLKAFALRKLIYTKTRNLYVPFDLNMLDREDVEGLRIFTNDLLKMG